MKIIIRAIQLLVGALFIFSGFVKAVDPLGTSYKMHDYFNAFSNDFPSLDFLWHFMSNSSTFWAVFMLVFELAIGFALLIGWRHKITLWLMLLLCLFFTLLTGYTYLSGYSFDSFFAFSTWKFDATKMKVTNCGCFGDFMKLTPRTSYWKDIVLDVLIIIMLLGKKHLYTLLKEKVATITVALVTVGSLFFCFSNYLWGLPIIDFRPYKIGTNLPQAMAMTDSVVMKFIYKKEGKEIALDMDQLKTIDSTYTYVDRQDIVFENPKKIVGFFINTPDGNNIADSLLQAPHLFLLIAYDLEKTRTKIFPAINDFANLCTQAHIPFVALTHTDPVATERFRHEHQNPFPFYFADEVPLKTMIRSNPGLIYLQQGTVKAMWHASQLPAFDQVKTNLIH